MIQLTGTLPNGEPVRMEFDAARCENGMAIVAWLCAKGGPSDDLGWNALQAWRVANKMERLP